MHQFEIMKKVNYIFTRDGGFSLYRKHHLEINTESFAEIVRVLHELIEQQNDAEKRAFIKEYFS